MHWYLVYTKPRQEKYALQNLEQQGYQCYLPMLFSEKLRQDVVTVAHEPLFPRYLFVQLGRGDAAKSWAPIRSTKGVSRLVSFGTEAASVGAGLIEHLRRQEAILQNAPKQLFKPGERVCLTEGAFVNMEGIYHMADGESRVMVLIELLSTQVIVRTQPASLRKVS